MFRCESEGYEAVVFGAFDGVTTWTNNAYINRGALHQEVVGAHEERHLRLQKGTPWGALLMLLAVGGDEERLAPLADACRRTHESYATYLSVAHVTDGIAAIADNPVYLGYWRTSAALAVAFADGPARLAVLEYLFHLVMSPAALAGVELAGEHAALAGHSPDERLAALTTLLTASEDAATAIADAVTGAAGVAETQDLIAAILGGHGLPTLSTADQLAHASRLMEQFNTTSSTHRARVAARSRATAVADQLDYQQFEVLNVHRGPVRLQVAAPPIGPGAPHPLTGFVTGDPQLGAHIWGVVLSADVLARQFVLDEPLEEPRYWGLLGVDRREDPPLARLWPLPDPPAAVTEKLAEAEIASVLMTTMSTLTDRSARTPFSPATPVFVLVDLPALPFLRGLQDEERPVRWVHAEADGDVVLHTLVLSLDGPDPLHFVMVRSAHTVRSTVEWLRGHDGFRHDPGLGRAVDAHLVALARHVTGTFWAFDTTRAVGGPPVTGEWPAGERNRDREGRQPQPAPDPRSGHER